MVEIWKPIPSYGGHYMASSLGRIKTLPRRVVRNYAGKERVFHYKERLLNPTKSDKWGHMSVTLGVDGRNIGAAVHRLVLYAFVGPCPDGMEACHNNGEAGDNRPENLRWDTHKANSADRKAHGNYAIGERHHAAKITEVVAAQILTDPRHVNDICAAYSVTKNTVHNIKRRKVWTHLPGPAVPLPGKRPEDYVRGERHHKSRFNAEKVRAIRADPRSQDAIAAEYGVTQSSIWAIKNRKTWAHVT